MAKTAFFSHDIFLKHRMDPKSPETPQRIEKIEELLLTAGRFDDLIRKTGTKAEFTDLLVAHDQDYLSFLARNAPRQGLKVLNEDTAMNPFTWEAALQGAGSCCEAVKGIMEGEYQRAFCAVRPPGHHAHKNRSGGFCFLNNAAIATLYAIGHYGLKRVAVCDFDVHHGDGTSDILGNRKDVLILDCFQEDLYPNAHFHQAPNNAIYSILKEGNAGEALRKVIDEVWMPNILKYQPELIVVSAGFDGHREEDQAQLLMSEQDYAFLGRRLTQMADLVPCCNGIVAVLEGGYNPSALARSCIAFLTQFVTENTYEKKRTFARVSDTGIQIDQINSKRRDSSDNNCPINQSAKLAQLDIGKRNENIKFYKENRELRLPFLTCNRLAQAGYLAILDIYGISRWLLWQSWHS